MSALTDWRALPLAGDGRSLVEASAGTGKTWAISVLYLRLLLEQGLTPRQVVVSTFTNAAADELRGRLRTRVLDTLALAETGVASRPADDHTDQCWLFDRWHGNDARRFADRAHLNLSLSELDRAPVSTLHRLCSRILADHPFAAGTLFKAGELVNADALLADLADDLWRLINEDATWMKRFERYASESRDEEPFSRGGLKPRLGSLLAPGTVVEYLDIAAIRMALPLQWAARLRVITDSSQYFRKDSALQKRWLELAEFIEGIEQGTPVPNRTATNLLAAASNHSSLTVAGKASEEIRQAATFSVGCVPILAALRGNACATFWAQAQAWARDQLKRRLEASNTRSFDALLTTVFDALQPLQGEAGNTRALADALFNAWPVALIDEFQDTDPVQYGILDAIYSTAEGTPRGRLVLIGDPKQAIYRFRGGDIHTYERAKARVAESDGLTLDTNHRSSRAYVEAVNQFYGLTSGTLGSQASSTSIAYRPVHASGRQDDKPYLHAPATTACAQPLVIHLLDEGVVDAVGPDRQAMKSHALRVCADQIATMLSEQAHTIAGKPLQPSDIAVLLPAHAQIMELRVLLRERGVPCVATSSDSVFQASVARDLLLVLHAVAHPERLPALRAAVATPLWGMSYDTLRQNGQSTSAWQDLTGRFHAWRGTWARLGLQAVIDGVTDQLAVRHLDTHQGERVLTDLRHLGELLQEHAESADGPESVLAWFRDQINGDNEDDAEGDARAIRIESDARRVQLMTLHASKGLEFNIVILPLMWAHGGNKNMRGHFLLSDRDGKGRKVGFSDEEKLQVRRELQDERHRILYVALTRAVHACHLYAGPLPGPSDDVYAAALETLLAEGNFSDEDMTPATTPNLQRVPHWPQPTGARYGLTADDDGRNRKARALPIAPDGPLPSRHSFTTLMSGSRKGDLRLDESAADEAIAETGPSLLAAASDVIDSTPASGAMPHPDLDALLGIAGADFGNAIHGIFEHRQPLLPLVRQRALVLDQLTEYNVQRKGLDIDILADRLIARLQVVLDTPLGDAAGPRLGALAAIDMRAELEFNYMLAGASLTRLREACAAAGDPELIPAHNQTLAGLMNGKIDLVFQHDGRLHVLDYKGNNLGSATSASLQDYAPAALRRKMDAVGYRFQALLYMVAVERYLRERIGDGYRRACHLGDCWYVFVRGVGLQLPDGTPCGVWRHRFSDALLDAVGRELSSQTSQVGA